MNLNEISAISGYQVNLHVALHDAVCDYDSALEAIPPESRFTEETATVQQTLLHYALEQRRAVALLLAASCVEALANLYIACRATPDQFPLLERATFVEKWTIVPSFFVAKYALPRDGELFQDVKRLHARRSALMHLKEEVSVGGVFVGSASLPAHAGDEPFFVKRCRTLPDRLLRHVLSYDRAPDLQPVIGILAMADGYLAARAGGAKSRSGGRVV